MINHKKSISDFFMLRLNFRCALFGHRWKYKDYSYNYNYEGQKFPYVKSRICIHCELRQVTKDHKQWITSNL